MKIKLKTASVVEILILIYVIVLAKSQIICDEFYFCVSIFFEKVDCL